MGGGTEQPGMGAPREWRRHPRSEPETAKCPVPRHTTEGPASETSLNRHHLDKADPEIVAADSRLVAGKTHHGRARSAADRCLAGRQ
jgi:hypothetical protein